MILFYADINTINFYSFIQATVFIYNFHKKGFSDSGPGSLFTSWRKPWNRMSITQHHI